MAKTLDQKRYDLIEERDALPTVMLRPDGRIAEHAEDQRAARYVEISDEIVALDLKIAARDATDTE